MTEDKKTSEESDNDSTPKLAEVIDRFMAGVKHVHVLGIKVVSADKSGIQLTMPYSEKIVGNPGTGVIHGGALTTLMDQALGSSVICALYPNFDITPTIDLRVDHMKPATPGQAINCQAEVYRNSKNVVFCRGFAYHEDESDPLCHAVGTFMRMGFIRQETGNLVLERDQGEG